MTRHADAKRAQGAARSEHEALRIECERLRRDVDALREQVREQANELRIQFKRIAEMQAILDEERIAADRESGPVPLYRQTGRPRVGPA